MEIKIRAANIEAQSSQKAENRLRSGVAARDPAAAAKEEKEIKNPIRVAGIPTYFSSQTI